MNVAVSKIDVILSHPAIAFLASICTIATFLWFIFEKLYTPSPVSPDTREIITLIVAAIPLLVLGIYSFRVRQQNRSLQLLVEKLHKINHDYRDVLCANFGTGAFISKPDPERARHEVLAISSVCQTAATIFNSLTHCDCMVTVKLITKKEGKAFATTYIRSEQKCARDNYEPKEFMIGVGTNAAFDQAIQVTPGKISHFYSADLTKEKSYRNQRDDWARFYRSAIIVPIRYVDPAKLGMNDASDDIGFLSVDTMSTNRLNNGFHLQFMAALADQMYNFMSLMRGKFSLPRGSS